MEAVCARLGSLFHSKKRTYLDLSTFIPHTRDFSTEAEREEMARREELSKLTTLLLHHRYEVAVHSQRVSRVVHVLAHHLCLSSEECTLVALAGQFHDVGKLCIPTNILDKPDSLTPGEWAMMRTHARIGSEMLLRVGGIGKHLAPLVAAHHECWDGSGYPDGLRGSDIPRGARLLSIADAYDAMRSTRPYQRRLNAREVGAEFQRSAGSQFDPQMCDKVLHVLEKEPDEFSFYMSRNMKEERT